MTENESRAPQKKRTAVRKKATKKTKKRTIELVTVPAQGKTTPEERHRQIAEAAYFRAEQRGFSGRDPERDWYEAEAEIDAALCRDEGKVRH